MDISNRRAGRNGDDSIGSNSAPDPESKRKSPLLRERVTADIRRLILENELQPGSHSGRSTSRACWASAEGPIREAIVELEREGLAQRRTGRSTVVLQLSQRDLEEVYSLRRAQEGVAISFAFRERDRVRAVRARAQGRRPGGGA